MKTKPPFNLEDDKTTKLEDFEQRILYFMKKKYDLLGVKKDDKIRMELYDLEKSIFWKKLCSTLSSTMSDVIDKKNKEKE